MNIQFNIKVHSFEKAAAVEKALKGLDFNYTSTVDDKPSLGAGKTSIRRNRVTKTELLAVVTCRDSHPRWPDSRVAKACGVSGATVGRIKMGTLPLMLNGADDEASV